MAEDVLAADAHLPYVNRPVRPNLDGGFGAQSAVLFWGILALGLFFVAYSLFRDISATAAPPTTWLPFALLGVALLIALGFESVNGFHDTANAVATVIYTHSLPAHVAVLWSGLFNFLGVLLSSGAVAVEPSGFPVRQPASPFATGS